MRCPYCEHSHVVKNGGLGSCRCWVLNTKIKTILFSRARKYSHYFRARENISSISSFLAKQK